MCLILLILFNKLGKVSQRNIINTGSNNISWRHTDMQVYATEHIVAKCSDVMIFNSMPQSLSEVDIIVMQNYAIVAFCYITVLQHQ